MHASIPVNSLQRHIEPLAQRLIQTSEEIIRSGHYVLGPHLKRFEQQFASWCGTRHAVGVANGTDALELGLRALGIGPGQHVAVVANAAMYGTTAVLACGAIPIFVDIDPASANMSVASLESAIARGRIDAVIITHLYGRLADMTTLLPICRKHGIKVMEDCAQAHGATDTSGKRAGSFGDISSFSFYPTKNLGALGDGGAILTSDEALALRSHQLRQYGWSGKYNNELAGGRNSRLDELQAALLLVMLPELDAWNSRRRDIANRYSEEIRSPALSLPAPSGKEYVAHLYVVRSEARDSIRDALAANGIQTDVHYPTPDYRQPCLQGHIEASPLPMTEQAARTVFTLPCFPEMTDAEVTQVIEACNRL